MKSSPHHDFFFLSLCSIGDTGVLVVYSNVKIVQQLQTPEFDWRLRRRGYLIVPFFLGFFFPAGDKGVRVVHSDGGSTLVYRDIGGGVLQRVAACCSVV